MAQPRFAAEKGAGPGEYRKTWSDGSGHDFGPVNYDKPGYATQSYGEFMGKSQPAHLGSQSLAPDKENND